MSKITVKVEFLVGTDIRDAIIEAREKARLWDVAYVSFDFNTVRISVQANHSSTIDEAVEKYHECLKNPEIKSMIC